MNTSQVLKVYSSDDFSVKWKNYNQDTGRLLLEINGTPYQGAGIPVNDFQHFKQLLTQNRGQALAFLKKSYTFDKVSDDGERASDESFDQLIEYLQNLVPREESNSFKGGVGDSTDPKTIDKKELTEGVKDEMHDHGVNPQQALDIVMDEEKIEPGRYLKEK